MFFFAALAFAALTFGSPQVASAQTPAPEPGRIYAIPQGLVGGALLGAELVMMIEGGAGVRNKWIIIGTGAAGLVAGGVGGFFVDRAIDQTMMASRFLPLISTAMLAVGLSLIIPTVIVVLTATMYRPDTNNQVDDNAAANQPLEESRGTNPSTNPGTNSGASSSGTTTSTPGPTDNPGAGASSGGRRSGRSSAPEALLNFPRGNFRLGMPSLRLVQSYSTHEMRQYGLAQQSEWRVPLISGSF